MKNQKDKCEGKVEMKIILTLVGIWKFQFTRMYGDEKKEI
jgi:hypothetical protein